MRAQTIIGAVVFISVGVLLGGTVLRGQVADAKSLAQAVVVSNTPAQAVPVHPAPASGAFSIEVVGGPLTAPTISGPDAAGTRYAITGFTVANEAGGPLPIGIRAFGCGAGSDGRAPFNGPRVVVPANDTVHLDFSQPFVVQPFDNGGVSACLGAYGAGALVSLTVVGYRL
jgi:hypothetical protein